jgi:hypothetical protein
MAKYQWKMTVNKKLNAETGRVVVLSDEGLFEIEVKYTDGVLHGDLLSGNASFNMVNDAVSFAHIHGWI